MHILPLLPNLLFPVTTHLWQLYRYFCPCLTERRKASFIIFEKDGGGFFSFGCCQFYNKIIFCSMVDRIRKSPRTAVGALSILPQPPPPGLFMMSAMRSDLGAALHSLSCLSPSWSPHRNNRIKTKRGRERYEDAPPRPVLIRGFAPGGLIGAVSRGMGCGVCVHWAMSGRIKLKCHQRMGFFFSYFFLFFRTNYI